MFSHLQSSLSLGNFTELMILAPVAQIIERDDYLVCRCLDNPGYYFGNFILQLKGTPYSLVQFQTLFAREFSDLPLVTHKTLIFNHVSGLASEQFSDYVDAGYIYEAQKVLSYSGNEGGHQLLKDETGGHAAILNLQTVADLNQVVEIQVQTRAAGFEEQAYRKFSFSRMRDYQVLIEKGMGEWFAYWVPTASGPQVACTLGVFCREGIARFQIVTTAPSMQNRGYAKALIAYAVEYARSHWQAKEFVMIADPSYHAIQIYKKLGFVEREDIFSLCLHPRK